MVEIRQGPIKPVQEGEIITEENVYDRPDETMSFYPGQVLVDLVSSFFLLVVVVLLSYVIPAPLTEPSDLSTTTYVPRPEWFFFFYDQMLMFFPGYALIPFGGVVIPGLVFLAFAAIPWMDREPGHSPLKRPFATTIAFLVIAVVVLNLLITMLRIGNFPSGTP